MNSGSAGNTINSALNELFPGLLQPAAALVSAACCQTVGFESR
jgi:hypothetical protein